MKLTLIGKKRGNVHGSSLVEACLAIGMMCLIFFGLFQISRVFAAYEILHYAAARGARAATVGFNRWMVAKCVRVGAIPNAGKLIEPGVEEDPYLATLVSSYKPGPLWERVLHEVPVSLKYEIERVRIPHYLGSETPERARFILDYSEWDKITLSINKLIGGIHAVVHQEYPLRIPLHRTFYAADDIGLRGESYLENHYELYLDDMGW